MKSVSNKIETLRRATAGAVISGRAEVISALMSGNTPKGNAVDVARVAGISAAKKTWDLIPYCHPLVLDQISINIEADNNRIIISASVVAIGKTGVEMEALTAASISALTLYDMAKAMDESMVIGEVCLHEKRGGKSDYSDGVPYQFRSAVLVTSDSTARGTRQDKSGVLIRNRLESYGIENLRYTILPDDHEAIVRELNVCVTEGIDLVVSTGGTGLGCRDVTVEAVKSVIQRDIPGIAEAMRSHGQRRTPYAMLSRGIAGVAENTIIVTLPGSSRGVEESLDAIFPYILHAYPMMRGGGH